jgi:DNA-binding NtrC family response regulator
VAAGTVLVVDDEQGIRELLRRWLTSFGYDVRAAEDARGALEAMLARPFDVLIVDIKLPGWDGFWLMERVRGKWPRTAIIVASGVAEAFAVRKAQTLGAVDYITKPFDQQVLRQALERAEARINLYFPKAQRPEPTG